MAELVYNEQHMMQIAELFSNCAKSANNITASLETAKNIVSQNYDGQGLSITNDTFDKLEEHLTFLEKSFSCISEYVEISFSTMQKLDSSLTY